MHKMKSVAGRENDNFYFNFTLLGDSFFTIGNFTKGHFVSSCVLQSEENNVRIESVWRMMKLKGGKGEFRQISL